MFYTRRTFCNDDGLCPVSDRCNRPKHDLHETLQEALKHVNSATVSNTKVQQVQRKVPVPNGNTPKVSSLLLGGDDDQEEIDIDLDAVSTRNLFKKLTDLIERHFPFKNDIRKVHAMFGGTGCELILFLSPSY